MARRPGRPSRGEMSGNASSNIVNAACVLYGRHGIGGVSNRQLAEEAGVTAAMVHYYFPDKHDLWLAVLQSAFGGLIPKLQAAQDLEAWVYCFHGHLLSRQWLPHLMLREVIPHDGALRALFIEHWASAVLGSVRAVMKTAFNEAGMSRKLDVDRHVVLLLGALVYPFLGQEVAQLVTGKAFDERMMKQFRDDALSLFRARLAGNARFAGK